VGEGCPDLLVARAGVNYLLEVKMPGAELTSDEWRWHMRWPGWVRTVRTVDEALRAIGAL